MILVMLVFPTLSAISLNVEEQDSYPVMIPETNKPAEFNLLITNLGPLDNLEFYNLLGFSMSPKGTINFDMGESKLVPITIYPREDLEQRGFYNFGYYIRSIDGTEIQKELTFKIIDLEDAFEVGSGEIDPESNLMEVYIHNRENTRFEEMTTKFNSSFFKFEETFTLGPNQRKDFNVTLNKEDFKKLIAGSYTFGVEVQVDGGSTRIEGAIEFVEKNILTTQENYFGGVVNTEIIQKKNEGNVLASTETVIRKNIISRLFTTFNPEPDMVDRQNVFVYYTWNQNIPPGEILTITVKTNWFFPFIIIILVGIILGLVKQYKKTDLILRKRATFVKAKGGEFALKVSMTIHAKTDMDRIEIIDRLPTLVKVYEKFGNETPRRVSEKHRRIEWDFNSLSAGETRVVSYIIYSKIGVLGKFVLPAATGIFEKNGKIHESQSNQTFFIAEQKKGEEEFN